MSESSLSLQQRKSTLFLHSRSNRILILLFTVFVPSEAFFIEGYDNLWTLMIGLLSKNKVSFVRIFPVRDEKNVCKSLDARLRHNIGRHQI